MLIGQLLSENLHELAKKTRLPQEALREIVEEARLAYNREFGIIDLLCDNTVNLVNQAYTNVMAIEWLKRSHLSQKSNPQKMWSSRHKMRGFFEDKILNAMANTSVILMSTMMGAFLSSSWIHNGRHGFRDGGSNGWKRSFR